MTSGRLRKECAKGPDVSNDDRGTLQVSQDVLVHSKNNVLDSSLWNADRGSEAERVAQTARDESSSSSLTLVLVHSPPLPMPSRDHTHLPQRNDVVNDHGLVGEGNERLGEGEGERTKSSAESSGTGQELQSPRSLESDE